jgi:hypothetical protein
LTSELARSHSIYNPTFGFFRSSNFTNFSLFSEENFAPSVRRLSSLDLVCKKHNTQTRKTGRLLDLSVEHFYPASDDGVGEAHACADEVTEGLQERHGGKKRFSIFQQRKNLLCAVLR